jgi:hypothetical protein
MAEQNIKQLHLFEVERAYSTPHTEDNDPHWALNQFRMLLQGVGMIQETIDKRGYDPKRIQERVAEERSRKSSCWFE